MRKAFMIAVVVIEPNFLFKEGGRTGARQTHSRVDAVLNANVAGHALSLSPTITQ